jgi:membrane fusion protein, multidrug efflux system
VQTGVSVNGKTEIFGSVQPGESVVANATDSIRNGTAVSAQSKPR